MRLSIFVTAATVAFGAAAASAQTDMGFWPETSEGRLSGCAGLPGISSFDYWNSDRDGRWKRYVLTETCYSPEGNWFVGSETFQDMEKIAPAPGFMGRYEILTDGAERHRRRSLDIGPLIDEMGIEDGPMGEPEIYAIAARIPSGQVTYYDGLTDARVRGWVYRTPLTDLQAMPAGLWRFSGGIGMDHRTNVQQSVEPDNFGMEGAGFLLDTRTTPFAVYPQMGGMMSAPAVALDVADGHISGSFSAATANPLRLEVRNPDAWDRADIQINHIFGRFAEEMGRPVALMLGVGRLVLYDEVGQSAIDIATLRFTGRQVPEDITDDMIRQIYPDFPGR